MKGNPNKILPKSKTDTFTRRDFIQMGGVVAGGLMLSSAMANANLKPLS